MNVAKEIQRGLSYIPQVISTILKLTNKCHSIQYKKMMTLLRIIIAPIQIVWL